jgi:FkbM family methyltransferase
MSNNLDKFLSDINKVHPINVIYDIGASNGNWSRNIKQNVLPEANMYLFEANSIHIADLLRTGFSVFVGTALSKPGVKEVTFYTGGTTTGDSYYKENTKWYNDAQSFTLPCKTLDEVVVEQGIPRPDFIKMDTQGSEVDILDGATITLQTAKLVYLECPIIPYNIGAPSIGEYIEKMRVNSFVPIGVFEVHMGENTLLQIDIMFMANVLKQKIWPNDGIRPLG